MPWIFCFKIEIIGVREDFLSLQQRNAGSEQDFPFPQTESVWRKLCNRLTTAFSTKPLCEDIVELETIWRAFVQITIISFCPRTWCAVVEWRDAWRHALSNVVQDLCLLVDIARLNALQCNGVVACFACNYYQVQVSLRCADLPEFHGVVRLPSPYLRCLPSALYVCILCIS